MKRLFTILPLLLGCGLIQAQLVNQGGTITIQPGATLIVESDVTNNTVGVNNGTINVQGTLEVQGDFTNNGVLTTTTTSLVRFTGDTNSDVITGGAVIENVEMAKDDALNGTVTLLDSMSINTNLNFVAPTANNFNNLVLGDKDLILTDASATITGDQGDAYIVTNGTGMVEKPVVSGEASFDYPVGSLPAGGVGAYTPLNVDHSGTAYTSALVRVNTVEAVHPNKPADADDFINRYWNVNTSGITDYSADLVGTYVGGDVVGGDATKVMGASQDDAATGSAISDWSFAGAGNAANQVSGTVGDDLSDFTGMNFWGTANLKLFLQGAYSGGTMTTTLPTVTGWPTSTPYSAAPWNAPVETYTTLPANVTDWILVEARDIANPSAVLAQKSGFVLNNGNVVDLDGGLLKIKDAPTNAIIAVRHRNHLGVRTDGGIDLAQESPTLFDISQDTAMYNDSGVANSKMKDVAGTFVLWGGDATSDNMVQYNGGGLNDRIKILLGVGVNNTTPSSIGYHVEDLNMDGIYQYNGGGLNDRIFILLNVGINNTTPILSHLN